MQNNENLPEIPTEKELPTLVDWLRKREPTLKAKFEEAMKRHGVEYM